MKNHFELVLTCLFVSGCCAYKASFHEPVADKYESYVLIGFGERPKCCVLPQNPRTSILVKRNENGLVWLRSVYKDNILSPAENLDVVLTVVDTFGDATPNATVEPKQIRTNSDGFSDRLIKFKAFGIGTFIIVATYKDRHSQSVSLSQTVIVVE